MTVSDGDKTVGGPQIVDHEAICAERIATGEMTLTENGKAYVEGNDNLDEAAKFLREHNYTHEHLSEILQDTQLNRKILRKIDWTLMPLLCITFFLQYIDKLALNYSAVFDLFENTGISQNQYSWLASIFYFAYLTCEWPSSYLAQRLPTATVISTFVLSWGCILLITASSSNFLGLAICRFLLGAFESIITPTFMMIVSTWYVKTEQPARSGAFYCFNGFGAMIGAILFYAVGYVKTFPVWKTIFLICGAVTILWGLVLLYYLPNTIMSAKRFTVDEKALLIARSQTNRTAVLNRKVKTKQIWEALTDSQVWLLFFFTVLNEMINGGFANFGQLILKGVAGNDSLLTTAYGIPQGAFQVVFVFSGPWLSTRFKNIRTFIMIAYLLPTITGISLLWHLPRSNVVGCLMGYYIFGAYVASLVLALQLPACNVGGYTKRVTATAFVFLGYCIGNIVGPHAFLGEEAPIYPTGCKMMIGCAVGQIVIAMVLRSLLIWRNKTRDNEAAAAGIDVDDFNDDDVLNDLTDFENPRFRYVY